MPSIVFWPGVAGGTQQYRCTTPGEALRRRGWEVSYVETDESVIVADVVVFQRVVTPQLLDVIRRLREVRPEITLVYDIDDWYDEIPAYNPASSTIDAQALAVTHEAMRLCDLITVSTPGLAQLYARFGEVAVLPNLLDPDVWWNAQRYRIPHDEIRIGWLAAYRWRGGDAEVLRPWLARFLADHAEVRFVALGCPELLEDFGIGGIVCKMAPYEAVPQMIGAIDIGLVPLEYNTFNWRGKSACKSIEYNAMGVPSVASPSEANRAYIRPGVNGLLVRKNNWTRQVEAVIDDLDGYRRRARDVAESCFIDDHIGAWVRAYGRAGHHQRPRRAVPAAVS